MGENDTKVALVTGAASGIGASLVRKLRSANIEVLGVDLDSSGLESIRVETGCSIFATDISKNANNIEVANQAVNQFGRLDYAFLNAGILGRKIEEQINPYTSSDLDPEPVSYTHLRAHET